MSGEGGNYMAETEIAETENLYFQTTDVFGRSPNTPNSYNVSSSTMSGGSRFQSLTVLGKKDFFLVSIRQDSI
jgi:hypothetical protein